MWLGTSYTFDAPLTAVIVSTLILLWYRRPIGRWILKLLTLGAK
jgi:4-amino-4-deoxy-L-arabinose transferase-like glycosyltransferase